MFANAYLNGQRNMVMSKSDLDRLKFMPQKIEGGMVFDFKNNTIFKDIDSKDMIIFDADRVNNTKRCTSALTRDYFIALDNVMHLFNNGGTTETEQTEEPAKEYGADIIECITNGDKKGLRTLLKEYIEVKWKGLDEDEVEDAVDDLKSCISNKDTHEARLILSELICDDICETKKTEVPQEAIDEVKQHVTANEDEAELLQDLVEAVEDEDWEDVELLLKELGKGHARYAEFEAKLPKASKKETKEDLEDSLQIISEICEDIGAALETKDATKAKNFLAELKDEAGEDSDIYKEYEAKVNPPKETTRRTRRGNR